MYHYTDCGLDNVYLANGFTEVETPYGKGISIHDTEGLHRAIGLSLVDTPKDLNGAEFRFLRMEMELTQRRLAEMLGADEQAVRRWERDRTKAIQGPADRLMRLIYTEYVGGDGSFREIIDRLAELDEIEDQQITMKDTAKGWERSDNMAA